MGHRKEIREVARVITALRKKINPVEFLTTNVRRSMGEQNAFRFLLLFFHGTRQFYRKPSRVHDVMTTTRDASQLRHQVKTQCITMYWFFTF